MGDVVLSERLARRVELVLRETDHNGLANEVDRAIRDSLGDRFDSLGPGRWAGLSCGHAQLLYDNLPKPKVGEERRCERNDRCKDDHTIAVVALITETYPVTPNRVYGYWASGWDL